MKIWATEIQAIDPNDGELKSFQGPNIEAPSKRLAQEWCQMTGLGYCKVIDELLMEVPVKEDGFTPDWDNVQDYYTRQNN